MDNEEIRDCPRLLFSDGVLGKQFQVQVPINSSGDLRSGVARAFSGAVMSRQGSFWWFWEDPPLA